ncbi:MAG: hypothetical protein ACRYG7_46695 [Janthinobacterium lividum]
MLFHVNAIAHTPELENVFASFRATQSRLQTYMEHKDYGEDIQAFLLGFICVSPAYNSFFKPRRDRYTKARKVSHKDGFEIVRERMFECEVLLPYDTLATASIEEVKGLLTQEVLQAVERLHKHKPKLESFDIHSFIQDIRFFFANNLVD